VSQKIEQFRGKDPQTFVAWLKKISKHKLLSEIRRLDAQKRNPGREVSLDAAADGTKEVRHDVPSDTSTPSVKASRIEQFEQALLGFDGTVLAVVHDRYFIQRFATEVWVLENKGIRRDVRIVGI
jgi:DNA-directed RNA polymerase specialized sigma24 family protein